VSGADEMCAIERYSTDLEKEAKWNGERASEEKTTWRRSERHKKSKERKIW
jgi:hypothetical protein